MIRESGEHALSVLRGNAQYREAHASAGAVLNIVQAVMEHLLLQGAGPERTHRNRLWPGEAGFWAIPTAGPRRITPFHQTAR